jgi:hypothetical protein
VKDPKHPIQPVVVVDDVVRFKENRIVEWMVSMLKASGIELNEISLCFDTRGEHNDDYQQLMQLIGYSVSGYGDLSTHDPEVLLVADERAAVLVKEK